MHKRKLLVKLHAQLEYISDCIRDEVRDEAFGAVEAFDEEECKLAGIESQDDVFANDGSDEVMDMLALEITKRVLKKLKEDKVNGTN
jgi:hypothetical protein